MTRHGHMTGSKRATTSTAASDGLRAPRGAPVGADHMDVARRDALSYLERTGNADVAVVLGLAADAAAARPARAHRGLGATPAPKPSRQPTYCGICQHTPPVRGGPCRRTMACRKAAEEESK